MGEVVPAIGFHNTSKAFADRKGRQMLALSNATFGVRRNEFVSVVGPSGCGKSTLLNLTAGLMKPTSGSVIYTGVPVTRTNTKVGYVTQAETLLPWRTVRQNIGLALEIRRVPSSTRARLVDDMIELVGLTGFADHYPSQLSGGMRKRAILGRTLIYEPETLLMDEPFGALDAQLKIVMQNQLLKIWSELQMTVVFVTHDLAEAITLSDRIVVMSARPGTVRSIESVELPRPRDVESVRFSPEFSALHQRLWSVMQQDMLSGTEM